MSRLISGIHHVTAISGERHSLKLAPQFEETRSSIEKKLIKFNYNPTEFKLLQ